ncbi:MAG TPA: amino acid transporter, partial [Blastocatellia bacterium]
RVHSRYRTPYVAVVVFALIVWLMAIFSDFAVLVAMSAIARLLFSATTCLSVPVLRRRVDAPSGFRVPGGAAIPVLAAAISVWLLTGINRTQAIAGAAAMVAGVVLYFIFRDRSE